ncbi:BTB/POZ and MATH domain-containing protein 6-like [Hibiscus syriacus]|uniref:BTB/POZ and MATH domain-containing protein 6-like n=1 Tax=Hibiscus syriacus TaxID=106335 RepID=UPI0019243A19|nr:BTB/POZ and MATH domain-containing protein 6-like [Hibiscus syriacus]
MPGLVFFNDFSLYSLAILIADQVARSISEAAPRHYILKIMSFSFLRKTGIDKYESGEFDAGGYKWKLVLYPHGNKSRNVKEHLSLYLVSADVASRIDLDLEVHAVFRFFLLDQTKDNYLTVHDATGKDWRFHRSKHQWGFDQLIPIRTFNDAGNGYLLDDSCVFGVEVFVTKEMCSGKGECLSMIDAVSSKHVWKIETFSNLDSEYHESLQFFAANHKWTIQIFPKGRRHKSGTKISIYSSLVDSDKLKDGSKIFAEFTLRIKDQQQSRHIAGKVRHWFSESSQESGWGNFVSLAYFHHTTSGCLVNDMCMVEAEVTVHAVANTMFDTRSQIVETNRLVRESRCK